MPRRISFRLLNLQVNQLNRTYSQLIELDMNEEMLTEVQEMVIGFMEKLSTDKASKEAQQQLQKKYGNGWNVIIGKGYGAAVTAVKVNISGFYGAKTDTQKLRAALYSFTIKACTPLIFGSVSTNIIHCSLFINKLIIYNYTAVHINRMICMYTFYLKNQEFMCSLVL